MAKWLDNSTSECVCMGARVFVHMCACVCCAAPFKAFPGTSGKLCAHPGTAPLEAATELGGAAGPWPCGMLPWVPPAVVCCTTTGCGCCTWPPVPEVVSLQVLDAVLLTVVANVCRHHAMMRVCEVVCVAMCHPVTLVMLGWSPAKHPRRSQHTVLMC